MKSTNLNSFLLRENGDITLQQTSHSIMHVQSFFPLQLQSLCELYSTFDINENVWLHHQSENGVCVS